MGIRSRILRELKRRVEEKGPQPPATVRVGEDLDSLPERGTVVVIMPGDDNASEGLDLASTVGRAWEVTIGISVAVDRGPDGWFRVEEQLEAVMEAVEKDRRLGGLLALDVVRGEVESLPREPAGKAAGATVTYELHYALPGISGV